MGNAGATTGTGGPDEGEAKDQALFLTFLCAGLDDSVGEAAYSGSTTVGDRADISADTEGLGIDGIESTVRLTSLGGRAGNGMNEAVDSVAGAASRSIDAAIDA